MTRAEMLATVGRQLNKASTLDPLTNARLLDHLNQRHRQILSAPGCQGLRRRQINFTSVAGQARYSLANGEALKHVVDTSNDRELTQRSLSVYRQSNPDPVNSPGTPTAFVPYGFEPVAVQPSDIAAGALEVFVKSSNVADTTQTVYLDGVYVPGTSALLNGTTPVSLGLPWFYIDKFYLSAVPAGLVTLHLNSGIGPELARIAGQTAVRHLAFYLDPTPTESLYYLIDAEFLITDLAQDTDTSWLPSDFDDVLVTGALIDELLHTDDTRLVPLQQQYHQRLGELKLKLARLGMDTGPQGGSSRYGPWGPATRW